MASLFISYSRSDIGFAKKLTEAFNVQELDVWIDWEGIAPTQEWWIEIEKGIEQADNFLFLISPDSAKSIVCRQEIEHAIKNGKRLIPVVVRDTTTEEVPPPLRSINWIFLRETDDFQLSFGKLIRAINTDYPWVQFHRRLQVKALEWERMEQDNSLLLRGKDLEDAETQLVRNASKEPYPTELQREYVLHSRQASDRQRRTTLAVLIGGAIALAALALFGFVQAGLATERANIAQTAQADAERASKARATAQADAEANRALAEANQALAEERAAVARAGELATLANSNTNTDFNLALLLAAEAFKTYMNSRTEVTLLNLMSRNPRLVLYRSGQGSAISSVAYHPGGKVLASGSADGSVLLWDASDPADLKELSTLLGHTDSVWSITFSPDGETLITASCEGAALEKLFDPYCLNGEIILWDVSDPRNPAKYSIIRDHPHVITIALSPDGKTLVSGSSSESAGTLMVWDVTDPAHPTQLSTLPDVNVVSLAFSADASVLATGNKDTPVTLWDMSEPGNPRELSSIPGSPTSSLAWSKHTGVLAIGFSDQIDLWDVGDPLHPSLLSSLPRLGGTIGSLNFNQSGDRLAAGTGNAVKVWNMEDPAGPVQIHTLTGHSGFIMSVFFSPNGKRIASGGTDKELILWDLSNLQNPFNISQFSVNNAAAQPLVFNPRSKSLAVSEQEAIVLYDMSDSSNPRKLTTLSEHEAPVISLAFNATGTVLASGAENGTMVLWDVGDPASKVRLATRRAHSDAILSMAFSPNGKLLASASRDETIILWDVSNLNTPVPLAILKGHHDAVETLAFHQGGALLVSGSYIGSLSGGAIQLYDVSNPGNPVNIATTNISADGITFSPDGKLMASRFSGLVPGTIIIWDMKDPARPTVLATLPDSPVSSIVFSADRTKLLAGGCRSFSSDVGCTGGDITLWDLTDTARPLQLLTLSSPEAYHLTVSPDGKVLASGGFRKTVQLWDLDPGSWIQKNCQRSGRTLSPAEWELYFAGEPYQFVCPYPPTTFDDLVALTFYSISVGDATTEKWAYARLLQKAGEIRDASTLNAKCWDGIVKGYASLMLPICDLAVEVAGQTGDDWLNGYRDSRGIARALNGDLDGAIEDFLAFVEWTRERLVYEQYGKQREEWIAALRAGQDPFTESVLTELRYEYFR